jgi:hypothetical protein
MHEDPKPSDTMGEFPPPLRFVSPAALPKSQRAMLTFDPNWQPEWGRSDRTSRAWIKLEPSRPTADIEVGGGVSEGPKGSIYMQGGQIYVRCEPGHKEHLALARKVLRHIEMLATNRYEIIALPSRRFVRRVDRGGVLWIGRDAARWANASADHFLNHRSFTNVGFKPLD